jgi:hypothetical protein
MLSAASRRFFDSLLNVVGLLTRAKLDDAKVREAPLNERILADDRFDLLLILADRDDDAPVSRNLPPRDEEIARGVVLLQETNMGGHVGVDLSEIDLVNELDDEHVPVDPLTR